MEIELQDRGDLAGVERLHGDVLYLCAIGHVMGESQRARILLR